MSLEKPLARLLEDPELGSELRADLLAARSYEVPFDAGAGLARFQAHLDSLPQDPSGTAHGPVTPLGQGPLAQASGTGLSLTGGKILATLALAAGLGWGALELAGGSERKASTAEQGAAEATTPSAPAPRSGNPGSGNLGSGNPAPSDSPRPSVPAAAPVPALERALPSKDSIAKAAPTLESNAKLAPPASVAAPEPALDAEPAPAVSDAPAPSAADRLAEEVAHLGELRRTLSADPARALTLADQGHARFADGALRQEREALALSALEKLGRRDALHQRGEAFLKRYPQSSFTPQVKRMLAK